MSAPSEITRGWRGVAAEQAGDIPERISLRLRARSRALLGSLLRPHKRTVLLLMGAVLLQNALSMAGPFLVKVGIDKGIPALHNDGTNHPGHGSSRVLVITVVLLAIAAVGRALLRAEFLVWSGRIGQSVLLDLRQRVFDHFQRLSLAFHERYTSGRVISRLTSDVDAISELLDTGLDGLITAALSVTSIAVILVLLDPPLGLATLTVFPVLWLMTRWFRRASAAAYRQTRETVALVIVHFVESLGGIRAVQAFRREPRNEDIFRAVNDDYRAANERSFQLVSVFGPGIKAVGSVTTAVVLLYGGHRVLSGQTQVGTLAAFLLYLRRFFDPMQELSQFYNSFQSAGAALEKLSGVLQEEPGVPMRTTSVRSHLPVAPWRGDVRFEGVRFGYDERVILPGFDLWLPSGQTVALVGETGAGKTTVARLLARMYDPQAGEITVDGVPMQELTESELRRAVVMVTQESFLFSGTVADNIAFGRPQATRREIEAAAEAIGADRFITSLPDGYDTDVRKRGGRLSSGQRQLVAFARAFLADPAVLVLDEATSSLDVPTERLVQRALKTVLHERTALIIAHRLTTVEIADRVLVLHDGRVVEDGIPAELIGGTGRYADLHRAWRHSLV